MPTTRSTDGDDTHLRLLCPQWQGGGTSSVRELASEFPSTWHGAATPSAPRSSTPSCRPTTDPRPPRRSRWGDEGLDLRVAIHFDVDTIDSNEIVLGLGAVPHGLTSQQVRRIVADVTNSADVVALTIAEFFPRQVMHLQQILSGFPLITPPAP
jgi:hypothetical protein